MTAWLPSGMGVTSRPVMSGRVTANMGTKPVACVPGARAFVVARLGWELYCWLAGVPLVLTYPELLVRAAFSTDRYCFPSYCYGFPLMIGILEGVRGRIHRGILDTPKRTSGISRSIDTRDTNRVGGRTRRSRMPARSRRKVSISSSNIGVFRMSKVAWTCTLGWTSGSTESFGLNLSRTHVPARPSSHGRAVWTIQLVIPKGGGRVMGPSRAYTTNRTREPSVGVSMSRATAVGGRIAAAENTTLGTFLVTFAGWNTILVCSNSSGPNSDCR